MTVTPAIDLQERIRRLQGPILVLGGSGFVGANLVRMILEHRTDVYGTTTRTPAWRLEDLAMARVITTDVLMDSNIDRLLEQVKPLTIFDCTAYGAYSFEVDRHLIYQTNFNFTSRLLERLAARRIACYVHAGSSSEYGNNSAGPREDAMLEPNSDYAVSKAAASNLIYFFGKKKRVPCVNLRLYSVYGPLEDSARLIPNLVRCGVNGEYPQFVNPAISHDFIYIDDACEAFIDAALNLREEHYGQSINIGTGQKTTIADIAALAAELFSIPTAPVFGMPERSWDVTDWYATIDAAEKCLGWTPRTSLRDGLLKTIEWYKSLPNIESYQRSSKKFGLDTKYSISAVIACYKDGQAIPIMYQRLNAIFTKLNVDHEIIFVNDGSPDDSQEVIRALSRDDRRVKGITHSRNFGSQAAFRSGMEIARMNSVVLLDGDLQDPPELIEQFLTKWREGFDVVYGRRVKREATLFMQVAYKLFYRVFDAFAYIPIPRDAGDFSLLDRRVVNALLRFPERDLFVRGVRAFAGFRQVGVDYTRPERMFGVTTNSLLKNLNWAKKGILGFSNVPLNMLSFFGVAMAFVTGLLMLLQIASRLIAPGLAPRGVTTVLLAIMFFGSVNLFAVALIGEYIAKIIEEVKRRPHFIRRNIIKDGALRLIVDEVEDVQ
jgi:nucleoside-diphosphate-sugar epimerase/glycosyltransferase involved in cell wall biosynthesis